MTRVLIVDDDVVQLRLTADLASRAGYSAVTATSGRQALECLRADPGIGAMVLDLVMPDLDGMAVLETMRRENLSTPVIVQTAQTSLDSVTAATRHGAIDFIVKPVMPERLQVSLRNALKLGELETLVRTDRSRRTGTLSLTDVASTAPGMDRVVSLCTKAARGAIPVLLEGEPGVGKQLLARAMHGSGDRAGKAFVVVNCAMLPANQIHSILFGHRRGAFTGAHADQPGKFVEAHNGTIFLDEVGELPLETQAELLSVLQKGEVHPLGAERAMRVNVRVICGTNRRLLNLTKAGAFREDLFYQLNVFPIYVPPLRDRTEDIAPLVSHLAIRLAAEVGKRVVGLSESALALLKSYDWPGNTAELESVLYRAVILAEGPVLEPVDFPQILSRAVGRPELLTLTQATPRSSAPVHIDTASTQHRDGARQDIVPDRFIASDGQVAALADVERDLIVFALAHYGNRMSRVARALGIGRSTLYRKLREYGLDEGLVSDAA